MNIWQHFFKNWAYHYGWPTPIYPVRVAGPGDAYNIVQTLAKIEKRKNWRQPKPTMPLQPSQVAVSARKAAG